MRQTQTQPPALLDLKAIKDHLRIESTCEDAYLATLIMAATAHAEKLTHSSMLNREITATFFAGETMALPQGPIVSVDSVRLNNTVVDPSKYTLETYGTIDLLRYLGGTVQPHPSPTSLVVEYTAGFGDDASDVPADIVHVIKCHVGLMYEQRELATDRTVTPVPFIAKFYELHNREPGVG